MIATLADMLSSPIATGTAFPTRAIAMNIGRGASLLLSLIDRMGPRLTPAALA